MSSGKPLTTVTAIVRKVRSNSGGYAMAVDVAASERVKSWHAEVVLPSGATATAGPATSVSAQGSVTKLTPASGVIEVPAVPGGKGSGRVNAAIMGSQSAPTHVRVSVTLDDGTSGNATVEGLYTTDKRGHVHKADEKSWPGSTKTQTDPSKFHSGGGFGHGGGGGGGGQFACDLFVDFANQTVKHTIGSDAGGGGGSGGGGGQGTEYQSNNHQGA